MFLIECFTFAFKVKEQPGQGKMTLFSVLYFFFNNLKRLSWTNAFMTHPKPWLNCLIINSDMRLSFWCSSKFTFYPVFPVPLLNLYSTTKLISAQCFRALSVSTWLLTRASGSACCQAMAHTSSSIGMAGEKADGGFMYNFTFKVQGTWFRFTYFSKVVHLPSVLKTPASGSYLFFTVWGIRGIDIQ